MKGVKTMSIILSILALCNTVEALEVVKPETIEFIAGNTVSFNLTFISDKEIIVTLQPRQQTGITITCSEDSFIVKGEKTTQIIVDTLISLKPDSYSLVIDYCYEGKTSSVRMRSSTKSPTIQVEEQYNEWGEEIKQVDTNQTDTNQTEEHFKIYANEIYSIGTFIVFLIVSIVLVLFRRKKI